MVDYSDSEAESKPRRRVNPAARATRIAKRKEWASSLIGEEAEQKTKEAALRLLDTCDRSTGECRQKLVEKGYPQAAIETAITRLVEVGILNDLRYAQMLARTRHQERGLVGQALRLELQRKRLPTQIIAQVMEEITEESTLESAQYLVKKKLRSLRSHPVEVQKRRLIGMLARKGYSSSQARQAIANILNENEETYAEYNY